MREFERAGVDGLLVVMLTYGPGMRVARALSETRLPICLANIQPVPAGHRGLGHGRPHLQPGRPRRAGHRERDGARRRARSTSSPTTGRRAAFRDAVERWARVARAITAWRSLRVAIFGYPMTEMGDIRVDEGALLRALGPQIVYVAPGDLWRGVAGRGARRDRRGARRGGRAVRDRPGAQRRGARGPHPDAGRAGAHPARARLPGVLDALRRDRRGRALRAAADGRGLDADGARLRVRGRGRRAHGGAGRRRATSCSATRTSPRCTRWTSRATRSS